jgi:hypothetical protein
MLRVRVPNLNLKKRPQPRAVHAPPWGLSTINKGPGEALGLLGPAISVNIMMEADAERPRSGQTCQVCYSAKICGHESHGAAWATSKVSTV